MGEEIQEESSSTSKSTVSRRFIQGTQEALFELMSRPLDEDRCPVLLINSVR